MEFLTILVSGLLGLLSPVGLVVDRTALHAIRSQFATFEQLQVRIDHTPSYQLLQGKVERVRIAGRSLQLKTQDVHITVLELDTDTIELASPIKQRRIKLKRPLQAGVRLVLTQQDVNKLLHLPQSIAWLQHLKIHSLGPNTGNISIYNFINPNVRFLANNRLVFQVELQNKDRSKPLLIKIESGVALVNGSHIKLVDPDARVNGEEVPPRFLNVIVDNINKQLNLRNLEGNGLQMRILKLKTQPTQLEIAAFLRIEPSSKFLQKYSEVSSSG